MKAPSIRTATTDGHSAHHKLCFGRRPTAKREPGKGAVHVKNFRSEPRCSLFVQMAKQAGEAIARVTFIGRLEDLEENQHL